LITVGLLSPFQGLDAETLASVIIRSSLRDEERELLEPKIPKG
jgi:hypothetical protein